MSTSIPELSGRAWQKQRTREALLVAARELLAEGTVPTVEQAARRARISRATAYRYFVNQRALLGVVHPEVTKASLLPTPAPADAVERIAVVAEEIMRIVLANEAELRASLRISLMNVGQEAAPPMRHGRRAGWFLDALSPLADQLGAAQSRLYAVRLAATVGIEPLVWLTDMAGLTRASAAEALVANAVAVAREAVGA